MQAWGCGHVAVLLTLLAGPAVAQERILAPAMPCAQVAGLIQARGAAVLSTGPYTYERVVRDQGFCEAETTTVPAYVRTADTGQCFAGYRCRQTSRGENRPD
jgi:hypothetical protein